MPPTPRRTPAKATKAKPRPVKPGDETAEFYEWDTFVEEARVEQPPFQLRVRRPAETEGGEDTFEMLTIPVPTGASYINLSAAQRRGDMAGVMVNLSMSTDDDEANSELFDKLMHLMSKADFPVVDQFATRVLAHYFGKPPKAADGSEGGAGE